MEYQPTPNDSSYLQAESVYSLVEYQKQQQQQQMVMPHLMAHLKVRPQRQGELDMCSTGSRAAPHASLQKRQRGAARDADPRPTGQRAGV